MRRTIMLVMLAAITALMMALAAAPAFGGSDHTCQGSRNCSVNVDHNSGSTFDDIGGGICVNCTTISTEISGPEAEAKAGEPKPKQG